MRSGSRFQRLMRMGNLYGGATQGPPGGKTDVHDEVGSRPCRCLAKCNQLMVTQLHKQTGLHNFFAVMEASSSSFYMFELM